MFSNNLPHLKQAIAAFPPLRWLWPVLWVFVVLRLIYWFTAFPNPDEAYYWLWGQHPGLSYYDHPPLLAWIQGLFSHLLGRSAFTLRLPNLITTGLLVFLYSRICNRLFGPSATPHFWLTVALLFASPLYFLFLALAWPDHLLILFSLLATFWFWTFLETYRADSRGESWRLFSAAIALALAILCKYNASFVILACLVVILASKRHRPLLSDWRLYLAGAIVASGLLPILLWNTFNDFQSFQYYVNRSVKPTGFQLKIWDCVGFVLFSILMFSPLHSFALVRVLRRPALWLNQQPLYWRLALWVFSLSSLILLGISLISTALYYWNITAYLLLLPLLSGFFLSKPQNGQAPNLSKPSLFLSTQILGLFFAVLLVVHYCLLPISALFGPDGDPDSRMLFGWKTVGHAVLQARTELSGQPFLATTDYRSASALAYELNEPEVTAISDRIDQFDFWNDQNRAFKGRDAVLLADDWHPMPPALLARFERVSEPFTIPVRRMNVWIKNYYVFKAFSFEG